MNKKTAGYLLSALNAIESQTNKAAKLEDIKEYISIVFNVDKNEIARPLALCLKRGVATGFLKQTPGKRYRLAITTAKRRRGKRPGRGKSRAPKRRRRPGSSSKRRKSRRTR